jgi:hypothetical protein
MSWIPDIFACDKLRESVKNSGMETLIDSASIQRTNPRPISVLVIYPLLRQDAFVIRMLDHFHFRYQVTHF